MSFLIAFLQPLPPPQTSCSYPAFQSLAFVFFSVRFYAFPQPIFIPFLAFASVTSFRQQDPAPEPSLLGRWDFERRHTITYHADGKIWHEEH